MFEDWWTNTSGEVSGTIAGQDYRFSFGERATEWWLLVISALIVGVLLGRHLSS